MSPTRISASGLRSRATATSLSDASIPAQEAPRSRASSIASPEPQATSRSRSPASTGSTWWTLTCSRQLPGSLNVAKSTARRPQPSSTTDQPVALMAYPCCSAKCRERGTCDSSSRSISRCGTRAQELRGASPSAVVGCRRPFLRAEDRLELSGVTLEARLPVLADRSFDEPFEADFPAGGVARGVVDAQLLGQDERRTSVGG